VIVKRVAILAVAATALAGAALGRAEDEDALSRAKTRGTLTACVDPYNFPYSANNQDPPGFDVEIARAIGARAGLRTAFFWADTGTRGGLGRALRQSIMARKCDFFMGIGAGPDSEEELREKKLALTRPYLGLGYILVVQGPADQAARLADLKDTKIGVPMSTPVDAYLFDNGYQRALYLRNREIIKAMVAGEIDAGMVWSPTLAISRAEFPDGKFRAAPGYTPEPGLRWNLAIAVPSGEAAMKRLLDDAVGELLKDGTIKKIVDRYGIPFFPPFE
jgi:polar amino acid transport system substrate-binding protein